MTQSLDGRISRRGFIKSLVIAGAVVSLGLNPFSSSEASPSSNIYVASDGTKIDITHLGKKNWNSEQEAVLEDCAKRYKVADYPDIPGLWEYFAKKADENPSLYPIIAGMNGMLNAGAKKPNLSFQWGKLFENNLDYMKSVDKIYENNPLIKFEVGFAYDNTSLQTEGEGIQNLLTSIDLLKKLPRNIRFCMGVDPINTETSDFLLSKAYLNTIRGPPGRTKDNIRGPPYDVALKVVNDAYRFAQNSFYRKEKERIEKILS